MACTLRTWTPDDASALVPIINSKKVQDNLRDGIPFPYVLEDAQYFIRETLCADPDKLYAFAILADGELAGSISIERQENVHSRTGELGYYLGERFWGHGIAPEAVRQICMYVFEHTDILRIYAEPYAYNTASCRVLEKSGFTFEGTLRSNAVKNGHILDMKMYSLLRGEV